jgi:hypothetical protein
MHIVTYKCIYKKYHERKGRLSQIYALSWKRRHQTSQAVEQYHVREKDIIRVLRYILETEASNITCSRLGVAYA